MNIKELEELLFNLSCLRTTRVAVEHKIHDLRVEKPECWEHEVSKAEDDLERVKGKIKAIENKRITV